MAKKSYLERHRTLLLALATGFVLFGAAVYTGLLDLGTQQQAGQIDTAKEGYIVDAKVRVDVKNLLAPGTSVTSGTIELFNQNSGEESHKAMESLTVSSGAATSSNTYTSGDIIGVKFSGNAVYYDYAQLMTVPTAASSDASQTLTIGTIEVLPVGDMTTNTDCDLYVTKDGADLWHDDAADVDGFDPESDSWDTMFGVRIVNEDTDTGFGYPGLWTDFEADSELLRTLGTYIGIKFELTGSSNTMTDVNDYLRFADLGGATKAHWGTSVWLFFRLDDKHECGWYDIDAQSRTIDGLDGIHTAVSFKFDFSGAISQTNWADEIDIELNLFADWSLEYALQYETVSQAQDFAYGEEASSWTYDISIG